MKSLSLYEEKGSFLNKLDSTVKILYVVAAILIPAVLGNNWVHGAWIALSTVLLMAGGVIKKTVPVIGVSGVVLVSIIIIQGMRRSHSVLRI
ncbi:MAG: hypothetical protein IKV59_02730 [Lachnospiraceae bacterium]|nr:hypothetical protein [Lachnospiraceae bacterium]